MPSLAFLFLMIYRQKILLVHLCLLTALQNRTGRAPKLVIYTNKHAIMLNALYFELRGLDDGICTLNC